MAAVVGKIGAMVAPFSRNLVSVNILFYFISFFMTTSRLQNRWIR